MAGLNISQAQKFAPIEQAPSQGGSTIQKKPHDGGVKTKPTLHEGTGSEGNSNSDTIQRGGGKPQRLIPNGSSGSAPGKPGLKPPFGHGEVGVCPGKPNGVKPNVPHPSITKPEVTLI